jgi:hypothetical protein
VDRLRYFIRYDLSIDGERASTTEMRRDGLKGASFRTDPGPGTLDATIRLKVTAPSCPRNPRHMTHTDGHRALKWCIQCAQEVIMDKEQ